MFPVFSSNNMQESMLRVDSLTCCASIIRRAKIYCADDDVVGIDAVSGVADRKRSRRIPPLQKGIIIPLIMLLAAEILSPASRLQLSPISAKYIRRRA
eukprot:scaffold104604_cov52-Prasinocladus_malaysianus.AAC.1